MRKAAKTPDKDKSVTMAPVKKSLEKVGQRDGSPVSPGSSAMRQENRPLVSAAFGKLKKIAFDDLKFTLLLINGPNLNMLGKRDPGQYGTFTLADVERLSIETAFSRGYKIECFQSNYEGAIIEKIHEAMDQADGIVINPGAFTHYSYAILDAIDLCGLPVIEAHISDITKREPFRRISVTAPACCGQIMGFGIESYSRAIHLLCDTIEKRLKQGVL